MNFIGIISEKIVKIVKRSRSEDESTKASESTPKKQKLDPAPFLRFALVPTGFVCCGFTDLRPHPFSHNLP